MSIQSIHLNELVTSLNLKSQADQEKTKSWGDCKLPNGAEAKNHWYPVFCGIGVIGTIVGIFLAVSHNFHVFPGNAAPISGYVLLGMSAISCMIAYVHQKHVSQFNDRVARAEKNYNQTVFKWIEEKLEKQLPKNRTLCVEKDDQIKFYHRLSGTGKCLAIDYLYSAYPSKICIIQRISNSKLYKDNPPLNRDEIRSLIESSVRSI